MESQIIAKWLSLYNQAQLYNGVSETGNHIVPDWYDPEQYVESQRFIKNKFHSTALAIFNGVLPSLAHPGLSGPHLYWDSLASFARVFRFVTGIAKYALVWVSGDPFDPKDKAYQSFRNIRSIHSHIAKKMNQRDGRVEGRDVVWINQLEMVLVIVRSAALGMIMPEHFATVTNCPEARKHYFCFMRVICYCLGVEDRFNVLSWPLDELLVICRYDFWTNIYPQLMSKQNLSLIEANIFQRPLFDKTFSKFVYFLWKNEIYFMARVTDKDVDNKFITVYSFVKRCLIPRLPNSLVIFLFRLALKRKTLIIQILESLDL